MNKSYKLILGDCLEKMKDIEDKSIDMILCDLPYGTTRCKWDVVIPFDKLWEQYKRVIKNDGAIVLFGSEPFTSKLILSNLKMFKYELIWNKVQGKQPFLAKIQPMKSHENILVFCKSKTVYNPQMSLGKPYTDKRKGQIAKTEHYERFERQSYENKSTRYPVSVLTYNNPNYKGMHPTAKPVPLLEYLIKTYTNENEVVLDNCMGSGSTGVACLNVNRKFIGIEKEEKYFNIAKERIENHVVNR